MEAFILLVFFLVLATLGAGWLANRILTAAGCGQGWQMALSALAAMLPIAFVLAIGGAPAFVYLLFPAATLVFGWITHWILTAAGMGRASRMVLSWIASMLPAAVYTLSVYPFSLKRFLQDIQSLSAFWIPFLTLILSLSLFWIPLLLFLEWLLSRRGRQDQFEHSLHS
jgi:hypothetical protein